MILQMITRKIKLYRHLLVLVSVSVFGFVLIVIHSSRSTIHTPEIVEINAAYFDNLVFQSGYEGPDKFQLASDENDPRMILVFSAYWDYRRSPSCARVVVVTITKDSPDMYCDFQLDFRNPGKITSVKGNRTLILEHRMLKYSAQFVDCCPNDITIVPKYIYFYNPQNRNYGVRVRLHNNGPLAPERNGTIALCMKPFHTEFDDALLLLEFLEYYRMMGVQKFNFYNVSVGPRVQKVLDMYVQEDLVTVLKWDLHGIKSKTEIYTEGIYGALNECLYRFMGLYEYVVNVDVDEFIVPKKDNHLKQLISRVLTPKRNQNATCHSGIIFENEFFYRFTDNDLNGDFPREIAYQNQPFLVTRYKTTKLLDRYGFNNRSKYIAIPENTIEMGNHFIYRPKKGCKMSAIKSTVASLHHYRVICERKHAVCLRRQYASDRSSHKFVPELFKRVKERCKNLPQDICYS